MITVQVFVGVILTVGGLDCGRADDLSSNIQISDTYNQSDILKMTVILQNVPAEATRYDFYHDIGECNYYFSIVQTADNLLRDCNVPAQSGLIPTDAIIYIRYKFDYQGVRNNDFYLQLTGSNRICSTKRILSGVLDGSLKPDNQYGSKCLENRSESCQIYVDFGGRCTDLEATRINCTQRNRLLMCESSDEHSAGVMEHHWYQRYNDGTLIGNIPMTREVIIGLSSRLEITIETFDDNTYISDKMKIKRYQMDLASEEFKIYVAYSDKNLSKNVTNRRTYSESERVKFTCKRKKYTHVGWVDPTGYRIITYETTNHSWSFNKADNGSMLCCLNFKKIRINEMAVVKREIEGFTELIYNETSFEDSAKDVKTNDESSETVGLSVVLLSLPLGVAAVLAFLVLIYVKTCHRVKSNTEVPTQAYVPHKPFYVNLLFRKECQREIYEREHVYEEIN